MDIDEATIHPARHALPASGGSRGKVLQPGRRAETRRSAAPSNSRLGVQQPQGFVQPPGRTSARSHPPGDPNLPARPGETRFALPAFCSPEVDRKGARDGLGQVVSRRKVEIAPDRRAHLTVIAEMGIHSTIGARRDALRIGRSSITPRPPWERRTRGPGARGRARARSPRRRRGGSRRRALEHRDEDLDDLAVELRAADAPQLRDRLRRGDRLAVGVARRHHVVGVGDGDHPAAAGSLAGRPFG